MLEEMFTKHKDISSTSIEGLNQKYGTISEIGDWPGYMQGHSKDFPYVNNYVTKTLRKHNEINISIGNVLIGNINIIVAHFKHCYVDNSELKNCLHYMAPSD